MAEHRPGLDIDKVTTGEHWLASQAKQLGLVDALCTSDDYLLAQASHHKVVGIRYSKPRSLTQKLGKQAALGLEGPSAACGSRAPGAENLFRAYCEVVIKAHVLLGILMCIYTLRFLRCSSPC